MLNVKSYYLMLIVLFVIGNLANGTSEREVGESAAAAES